MSAKASVLLGPRVNFGFWVGVPVVVFAGVANVFKLVLTAQYWYANASVQQPGVDPVTGFALGVGLIAAAAYLLQGLRKSSVWAAVGLVVVMPLLYVVMVDGVTAAVVHDQMYFVSHPWDGVRLEVVPATALALVYGVQALVNYHQRFRQLR